MTTLTSAPPRTCASCYFWAAYHCLLHLTEAERDQPACTGWRPEHGGTN